MLTCFQGQSKAWPNPPDELLGSVSVRESWRSPRNSSSAPICGLHVLMAPFRAEITCRVAPAGRPAGALTRSGQGDFHHPALPATRLAALTPSAARLVRYLPELRGHGAQ